VLEFSQIIAARHYLYNIEEIIVDQRFSLQLTVH
jgi:hypothetical protein